MFEGSDVEKNGFKIGQKSPVQTQGGFIQRMRTMGNTEQEYKFDDFYLRKNGEILVDW